VDRSRRTRSSKTNTVYSQQVVHTKQSAALRITGFKQISEERASGCDLSEPPGVCEWQTGNTHWFCPFVVISGATLMLVKMRHFTRSWNDVYKGLYLQRKSLHCVSRTVYVSVIDRAILGFSFFFQIVCVHCRCEAVVGRHRWNLSPFRHPCQECL